MSIASVLEKLFGEGNTSIGSYEVKQYGGSGTDPINTWTTTEIHETDNGYAFVDEHGNAIMISGNIKITGTPNPATAS